MDIIGEIIILFFLLYLLGLLFHYVLPIISGPIMILLDKFKKLGMPNWIYWTLGFIAVWSGVGVCLFLIAIFANKVFGW
jgi:hypothetical protein|tara:strand:+ start:184 stop:420 length:237 start_codon:yes stop_codon:yes gene_type:complete